MKKRRPRNWLAPRKRGIAQANEKLAGKRLVQVEAEKKRADEEKQIAQAVKDFLQDKLLSLADTTAQADQLLRDGGLAADAKLNPTICELLDRAAKELAPDKIEANFPNQPLVQAEILRTVGEAYRGVGEAGMGIDFLARSLALFRQHLGPDHPDTLKRMNNLANGYLTARKLDQSLPLCEEALKLTKAKLGPDHPDTLTSMYNLANGYMQAGKLDQALPLHEEALELRKVKLGPDHVDTLRSMSSLAYCYSSLGQFDKAIRLAEELVPLLEQKLGRADLITQMTLANLGVNYKVVGRLAEAIPLLEEAHRASMKHATLRFVGPQLLDAYATAGKPDNVINWQAELDRHKNKSPQPDSPKASPPDDNQSENEAAKDYGN